MTNDRTLTHNDEQSLLDAAPLDAAAPDDAVTPDDAAPVDAATLDDAAPSDALPDAEADAQEADASTPTEGETEADEKPMSTAEREYHAALETARALGLERTADPAAVDQEADTAVQVAARLGLDQPAEAPTALAILEAEPEPADAEEDEADILGPEVHDGRAWYVLNTYSGHENRVQVNLERRIASMDVSDRIFQIVVPTQEELEIRGGERRKVQRKLLPGYVLVEMILDDVTWYVVRNAPGVTGFVGTTRPNPLPREEVRAIMRQMRVIEPRVRVGFALGDSVRVMDGPFIDFLGQVDEINIEKGKVRVLIAMFGRDTPVELDFLQVEKT